MKSEKITFEDCIYWCCIFFLGGTLLVAIILARLNQ